MNHTPRGRGRAWAELVCLIAALASSPSNPGSDHGPDFDRAGSSSGADERDWAG